MRLWYAPITRFYDNLKPIYTNEQTLTKEKNVKIKKNQNIGFRAAMAYAMPYFTYLGQSFIQMC